MTKKAPADQPNTKISPFELDPGDESPIPAGATRVTVLAAVDGAAHVHECTADNGRAERTVRIGDLGTLVQADAMPDDLVGRVFLLPAP